MQDLDQPNKSHEYLTTSFNSHSCFIRKFRLNKKGKLFTSRKRSMRVRLFYKSFTNISYSMIDNTSKLIVSFLFAEHQLLIFVNFLFDIVSK